MKCSLCKNDLAIAASFFDARINEAGGTDVYSVIDLKCLDEHCPNGRSGIPVKRVSRLVTATLTQRNAVECCGVPLLYVGEDSYFVPDGVDAERSVSGDELTAACPRCGKLYMVDIKGKTERKEL